MKRIFLLSVLTLFTVIASKAESNLTIFLPGYPNTEFTITINGKQISGVERPVTKEVEQKVYEKPIKYYDKSYKPVLLEKEGKYVIVVTMSYTNPINLKVTQQMAEYQIVAEDGDVIYLDFHRKGFNDCQISELDSKQAQKKFKDKKLYAMPKTIF